MRTTISRIIVASVMLMTAFGTTGCGPKTQDADKPAVGDMGNTINDGTFGPPRPATAPTANPLTSAGPRTPSL